jgi:methylated-DNA-protein-cysteine methyltransferase-like protein
MAYSSPPDQDAFYQLVWKVVREIPEGQVATYGQIADIIPPPPGVSARTYRASGPRWVGGAMAACPLDVPWQRVINAQGRISLRRGGGYERQRELLLEEGVSFDEKGRIDLKRYRWGGPSPEWLEAHGMTTGDVSDDMA